VTVALTRTRVDSRYALQLQSVSKSVGSAGSEWLMILDEIDLTVEAGQTVSIMGKSGSGKSTLLSLMGLLSAPSSGSVKLTGIDSGMLPDAQRARLRNSSLGFIFQNYSLIPRWTVLQNCQLPLLYQGGLSTAAARRMAIERLEELGLGDRLSAFPRQLSGGEQQRVAIARALITGPKIILADEPTGALDASTAATVLKILTAAVSTAGCSLIIVTHDEDVAACADERFILAAGRLSDADGGSRP
jgi:putative ABC transport system ATP-binding protein